jgi:hypothetical protein
MMRADIRMVDEVERPYGIKHIDNKIRVSAEPYLYDIAEGLVPGHSGWSKMGFNSDVQTAEEIISPQGGTYAFPTAKMQMAVSSSSVEDDPAVAGTGAAGTGLYSITIYYLDNDYIERSETVTLNGQTVDMTAGRLRWFSTTFKASYVQDVPGVITITSQAKHISLLQSSQSSTICRTTLRPDRKSVV